MSRSIFPPLSTDAVQAWRLMRDQGGYWSAGDLGQEMRPWLTPVQQAMTAARWLTALHRRRHVSLNSRNTRINTYGVTTSCTAPNGESLEPCITEIAA